MGKAQIIVPALGIAGAIALGVTFGAPHVTPHGGAPVPVAHTATPTPSPYPSAATLNEACLAKTDVGRFAPELCEEAPDGAAFVLGRVTKPLVWHKVTPVTCDATTVADTTITLCPDGSVTTSPSLAWAAVRAHAVAVGFKPVPKGMAAEEFAGCLWPVGDTDVIICPDGRVDTS